MTEAVTTKAVVTWIGKEHVLGTLDACTREFSAPQSSRSKGSLSTRLFVCQRSFLAPSHFDGLSYNKF